MSVRVDQNADRPYADAIRNNFASLASLHPHINPKEKTKGGDSETGSVQHGGIGKHKIYRSSKRSHKSAPPATSLSESDWAHLRNVYPYLTYCYRNQRPYQDVSHYATTRRKKDYKHQSINGQPPLRVYRIFDDTAGGVPGAGTPPQNLQPQPAAASPYMCNGMPQTHPSDPMANGYPQCCHSCSSCSYGTAQSYPINPYPYPVISPPQPYLVNAKVKNPSDCSSESSWGRGKRKRCMIGWGLGLTALLVLGLSVALFIQVRRDANRYRNKILSTAVPITAKKERLDRRGHHTFYFGEDQHNIHRPEPPSRSRSNPFIAR